MACASTSIRRLLVRYFTESAGKSGATLLDLIKGAALGNIESVKSGRVIQSTSANGHTTVFTFPGGLNPVQIAETSECLWTLYETCRQDLITAGTPSPTDAQISAAMLASLDAPDFVTDDFSGIRC